MALYFLYFLEKKIVNIERTFQSGVKKILFFVRVSDAGVTFDLAPEDFWRDFVASAVQTKADQQAAAARKNRTRNSERRKLTGVNI